MTSNCLMFQTNVKVESKDGKDTTITFRKILLNKCQKEFEKEKSDEIDIHEKMDELLKQGLSVSICMDLQQQFCSALFRVFVIQVL